MFETGNNAPVHYS